ncbi:MAG: Uma2 family endonuclease [Methylococcales bacterium]
MTDLAVKEATYQDIIDLPDTLVGEIVHGQLETHPRPAPKHAVAASSLGFELGSPFHKGRGGSGGWWILDEPECHLGDHVLVPDLAGWRRERMPSLPETAWFEIIPDWICEILSPSTARVDRILKMPNYTELGVAYLWLIDPDLETLECYELQNDRWVLSGSFSEQSVVAAAPFAEHTFSLSELWE